MKFTVQRNELLSALTIAGKAIGKSIIPILDNYRFQIQDGKCLVTGSNMEIFIRTPATVISADDMDVCIGSKQLLELTKALPDQPICFELKGNSAKISHNNGSVTLPFYEGKDYPIIPEPEKEQSILLDYKRLIKGIDDVTFAIGDDAMRNLNYVNVEIGNGVALTATTTRVLSSQRIMDNTLNRKDMLVNKNVFGVLVSMNIKEQISMTYTDRHIIFKTESGLLITSINGDGAYPQYQKLLPKDPTAFLSMPKNELYSAIKRTLIFSNKLNNAVSFNFNKLSLSVSSEDIDFETQASEELKGDYNGEDMVISMSGTNLSDILQRIDGESVYFSFKGNRNPVIIRGDDTQNFDRFFLTMPVINLNIG